MPAVTQEMADLKDEILSKIDQKFNKLKLEFLSELKDQIKKEVSEATKTEIKKREELESTASLLQEHVKNFQKQVSILECKNDGLEQYGRNQASTRRPGDVPWRSPKDRNVRDLQGTFRGLLGD